jgi:hypothetical protein
MGGFGFAFPYALDNARMTYKLQKQVPLSSTIYVSCGETVLMKTANGEVCRIVCEHPAPPTDAS